MFPRIFNISNLFLNLLSRTKGAKLYLQFKYFLFILLLHLSHHFSWTFIVVLCILFWLLNYFALNSTFFFWLTVLFNNIATFFEETLCFVWLKVRNKMSFLYLRKVSLIKYIQYKYIQMTCWEPFRFHMYMLLREHIILILQHFDWVLCVLPKCDWMNNI